MRRVVVLVIVVNLLGAAVLVDRADAAEPTQLRSEFTLMKGRKCVSTGRAWFVCYRPTPRRTTTHPTTTPGGAVQSVEVRPGMTDEEASNDHR